MWKSFALLKANGFVRGRAWLRFRRARRHAGEQSESHRPARVAFPLIEAHASAAGAGAYDREGKPMTEPLSRDPFPLQLNHTISRRLALGGAGLFMLAGGDTAAYAQTQSVSTEHLRFIQPPNASKQTFSHVVEA